MAYCGHCGNRVDRPARFCPACGASVDSAPVA
ncbi:MAG: zinc-ribbon domain-containing protein, partial [Bifidobacterium longum]